MFSDYSGVCQPVMVLNIDFLDKFLLSFCKDKVKVSRANLMELHLICQLIILVMAASYTKELCAVKDS